MFNDSLFWLYTVIKMRNSNISDIIQDSYFIRFYNVSSMLKMTSANLI